MLNESTLFHNISPDDFFSKLKEIIAETVSNISPQIQVEKRDELLTAEETALYFKKSTRLSFEVRFRFCFSNTKKKRNNE